MSWPQSTHFGSGRDASANGRKGGRRKAAQKLRTDEWLRGYAAGWKASEHWFVVHGKTTKRGRHAPRRTLAQPITKALP